MTHPDPRVREIRDRNARAIDEAVHAPPLDIVDDPAAFLRWVQQKPTAPPAKRPRPFGSVQPRTKASGYVATPPRHDERNRQLDALQKLIDQDQQATPEQDPR